MLVTTDKSSYTLGETVRITVSVTKAGAPEAGASVQLKVTTANGTILSASGTTDANGRVTFSFMPSRTMGKGQYLAEATATSSGYSVTDSHTFTVN